MSERYLFNFLAVPKHNQKFRLPYMGSKQQYASRLMQAMIDDSPAATSFIDVFGGGGSMSFLAIQCGFEKVIYNDLDSGTYLIINYFANGGEFKSEWLEFCSHEKFKECLGKNDLKSEIWKLCYSFGNKRATYFCNSDKENFKKQAHNFVIFYDEKAIDFLVDYFRPLGNCYREFKDYCLSKKLEWYDRRKLYTQIVLKIEFVLRLYELGFGDKLNIFQVYNLENWLALGNKELLNIVIERIGREALLPYCKIYKGHNKKQPQELQQLKQIQHLKILHPLQHLEQLEQLQRLQRLEQMGPLQNLEHLQHLEQLQQTQRLRRLSVFNLDYKNLPLDIDAIIYLDPPYKDTEGYRRVGKFNHDEFYEYFSVRAREGYNIYLSERTPPPIPHRIIWVDKVQNKISPQENVNVAEYLFKLI